MDPAFMRLSDKLNSMMVRGNVRFAQVKALLEKFSLTTQPILPTMDLPWDGSQYFPLINPFKSGLSDAKDRRQYLDRAVNSLYVPERNAPWYVNPDHQYRYSYTTPSPPPPAPPRYGAASTVVGDINLQAAANASDARDGTDINHIGNRPDDPPRVASVKAGIAILVKTDLVQDGLVGCLTVEPEIQWNGATTLKLRSDYASVFVGSASVKGSIYFDVLEGDSGGSSSPGRTMGRYDVFENTIQRPNVGNDPPPWTGSPGGSYANGWTYSSDASILPTYRSARLQFPVTFDKTYEIRVWAELSLINRVNNLRFNIDNPRPWDSLNLAGLLSLKIPSIWVTHVPLTGRGVTGTPSQINFVRPGGH